MATLLELAQLSAAAYGDPLPTGIPAGSIWIPLEKCDPLFAKDEYFGQAYQNSITHEIVITNRGTRPSSPTDLWNDLKLSLHVATGAQDDAATYALKIATDYPGHPIIETGHSLGGNDGFCRINSRPPDSAKLISIFLS